MPEITSTATTQTTAATTTSTSTTKEDAVLPLELEHTFTDFEDVEHTETHHFRRPMRAQISRAVAGINKRPMDALRTLCLDCVVATERDKLKANLDKYEGLASTFGNEILARCGFGELGK